MGFLKLGSRKVGDPPSIFPVRLPLWTGPSLCGFLVGSADVHCSPSWFHPGPVTGTTPFHDSFLSVE